ncbi:MAG: hypothetical protein NT157_04770 [Candidatus Micrarchaeota archaeon]|nr:hypothetical protein [Candidatus Micrarchaeota archaeon]
MQQIVFTPKLYGEGEKKLFTMGQAIMRVRRGGPLDFSNQLLTEGDRRSMSREGVMAAFDGRLHPVSEEFREELGRARSVALPSLLVRPNGSEPVVYKFLDEVFVVHTSDSAGKGDKLFLASSFEAEARGSTYHIRAKSDGMRPDFSGGVCNAGCFVGLLTFCAGDPNAQLRIEPPFPRVAIACLTAEHALSSQRRSNSRTPDMGKVAS